MKVAAQRDAIRHVFCQRVQIKLNGAAVAVLFVDADSKFTFLVGGVGKAQTAVLTRGNKIVGMIPCGEFMTDMTAVETLYHDLVFTGEFRVNTKRFYGNIGRDTDRKYLWENVIIVKLHFHLGNTSFHQI